jgi:hypothetical protein
MKYIFKICIYLLCINYLDLFATPIDNGNGSVTISNTGLIWQKCSNGQNITTCSGTATTLTWLNAISYCEGLTLSSRSDWRLPNINELRSIVSYIKLNSPTIDITFFPSTQSLGYWSSSTYAKSTSRAWNMNFYDGVVDYSLKTGKNYVRCVTGP